MDIITVPALDDNYMYLIVDRKSGDCAAVDPVQHDKILSIVKEKKLNLTSILTTHHHWDHAGGNEKLMEAMPNIGCYGFDNGKISALTCSVKHGQTWKLGSLEIKVLYTPCHTNGHVCYHITEGRIKSALFTGDTLFVGGCGRFFEGTAEQMHTALCKIIPSLPGFTEIYCGHEYTVANLAFAEHVDPDNISVKEKLFWAMNQRSSHLSTIPSRLEEEMTYNPFMRVNSESLKKRYKSEDEIEVMKLLRIEKNEFQAS